jgi:hypothetical protein
VLGGDESLAEDMGRHLWPGLAAAYITQKLKPIQPDTDAEVGSWGCQACVALTDQRAAQVPCAAAAQLACLVWQQSLARVLAAFCASRNLRLSMLLARGRLKLLTWLRPVLPR